MKVPQPRALCGFYDDSDPRLWDYYIDWMTRYGVDFLSFDWYYNDREDLLSNSLDKGFLKCETRDKVKSATIMATGQKLAIEPGTNSRLWFRGLPKTPPHKIDTVIKMEIDGKPDAAELLSIVPSGLI